jgi:fatty acid desaturase
VTTHRFTYWFLFAIFIVAIVIGAIRPLRVSPLYQLIGVIQFAAMALAAWILGARAIMTGSRESRLLAIAGIFLITPFALLALLWVGLGPPWEATLPENQMRYLACDGFHARARAGTADFSSSHNRLTTNAAPSGGKKK